MTSVSESRTPLPAMPIDDLRHAPAIDDSGASPLEVPVRAASAPAGAEFSWAFGRPVTSTAGDDPAWREFLAPGASGDDAWLDYLRR